MTELYNDDGMSIQDMEVVYDVLEQLRENAYNDGRNDDATILNEAHCLVQQYDEGSNWSEME